MDTITLTMKEQQRVAVIERVFRGELTMAEAAMVLGVSERQSFRLKARIRKEGVAGIIMAIAGGRDDLWGFPGSTVPRKVRRDDRVAADRHERPYTQGGSDLGPVAPDRATAAPGPAVQVQRRDPDHGDTRLACLIYLQNRTTT
jgi:hypothetical protein